MSLKNVPVANDPFNLYEIMRTLLQINANLIIICLNIPAETIIISGSSAKMASKLCIPENVVDKEKIHSRIFSQAPLQAPSYTGATFFVNRLTKAQEVTKNRKKRFQAEPLVRCFVAVSRAGVRNLRPAGHMRPA